MICSIKLPTPGLWRTFSSLLPGDHTITGFIFEPQVASGGYSSFYNFPEGDGGWVCAQGRVQWGVRDPSALCPPALPWPWLWQRVEHQAAVLPGWLYLSSQYTLEGKVKAHGQDSLAIQSVARASATLKDLIHESRKCGSSILEQSCKNTNACCSLNV